MTLRSLKPYALATLAADITVAALVALQPRLDLTVIALVMVLTVMFCALLWRSGPALLASVICVLSFNYFFIAPFHTFVIAKQDDFIAFTAFAIIAIMIGQLSARAETRAEQAEARRVEIEDLYEKLKKASGEAAEAELLRRSEKLKTALLDAVTHDLRTPLTSIKAAVTSILSDLPKDDEYLRELLQVIDEESDRLNRFIQEMMDLAQLEGGKMEWKHSDSTALEIIEIALERAAPVLAQHKVEVAVDDSLPHLLVDASAISQVLYSLLENAAKYSAPHSRIHISAESSGPSLLIRVQDEGVGIAKEHRERVFDKFFRVSNTERRPGFGLGLSIAKGIVESHGGRIWIEDFPGTPGTSLAVAVPMKKVGILVQSA